MAFILKRTKSWVGREAGWICEELGEGGEQDQNMSHEILKELINTLLNFIFPNHKCLPSIAKNTIQLNQDPKL